MSKYSPKNYFTDGGDTLVVTGKLDVSDGEMTGGSGGDVDAPTQGEFDQLQSDYNDLQSSHDSLVARVDALESGDA